ncbi:MAG: type II secretion system protein [Kiritimatiellae bacterium]|nr:type II secretion system protein [Kiritimatiellia bacterium]MDD5522259.1 type II secretion system protein [Kiritimatiellia bacterium]
MKRSAFTLIELLMVVVVIGILLGLMSAAIKKSVRYANEKRAKSDARTLAGACQAYRTEYGRWPIPDPLSSLATNWYSNPSENASVIEVFTGTGTEQNPRQIKFLNLGDYVRDISGNVLNPITMQPYRFFVNLDVNTNSVY